MKTPKIARTTLGIGAALGAAFLVPLIGPATMASASTTVNVPCSGAGGGVAGLITAIDTANAAGGGIINLAAGCTYALNAANSGNPMTTGANGLPVATGTITVNGSYGTTIAGNNSNFRIFEVDGPGGNLTLQGLTITGGNSVFGGGILNVEGALTLNGSTVTGNTAQMGGGGIASGVVNPNDLGPIGTLTLNDSQVTYNTTVTGGGGGILNHAGTLTLNFSQVMDNTSNGGGGGIASGTGNGGMAGGSNLNLYFAVVDWNTSYGGPNDGAGGIANGGAATIIVSEVDFNSAPSAPGGGILNHGTMTIGYSNINFNTANDALGEPGDGGGIANLSAGLPNSGVLTIDLSNVLRNSTSGLGGGIFEAGINPNDGTFTAPGNPLVLNSTFVVDNTSASGGGIYSTPGSPVTLNPSSVLVVENVPGNCFPEGGIPGCSN